MAGAWGHLDHVFTTDGRVREGQFVQPALDRLRLKIVRDHGYDSEDERQLLRDLRSFLGDEIAIELEYVEEIARDANGKFRQVISHIARPGDTTVQDEEAG